MEYVEEVKKVNGATIINCHPVLEQDVKEERQQEFLKTVHKILKKYKEE